MRTPKKMTVAVVAVIVAAVALGVALSAQAHPDKIRPEDQALAQKLSVRESDLPGGAGVRQDEPASNRVRMTGCTGEPRVLSALTGFRDSPTWYIKEVGPVLYSGVVRVFSSESVAARWFKWAASSDGLPLCNQTFARTYFEKEGYKVTAARRFLRSFKPHCWAEGVGGVPCPRNKLKAWGVEVRVSKEGERTFTDCSDGVLVQVNRVVLSFLSSSEDEWYHESGWEAISEVGIVGDVLSRFPKNMR